MINENAALLHHFRHMSQAQWVRCIPAHARQHDLQWIVKTFESLAQCAVDQTLVEIKHDLDRYLRLLRAEPDLIHLLQELAFTGPFAVQVQPEGCLLHDEGLSQIWITAGTQSRELFRFSPAGLSIRFRKAELNCR